MEFECRNDDGFLPAKRADGDGALWSIGVRSDHPLAGDDTQSGARFSPISAAPRVFSLAATFVTTTDRVELRIASDSTDGLLRTGAILLDLSMVKNSPKIFSIELRSPRGFERPPRVLRIEPNILPIVQGHSIRDERHVAIGVPDWAFQLEVPGLRFEPLEPPVTVELREADSERRGEWREERLRDSGPDDDVYEFEALAQRVTFGNGVNGRIPPADSDVLVTYAVSDGDKGGVAANRKWHVDGFAGAFGVNLDAVAGGAASTGWLDDRREARRRVRDDHALVTSEDIVSAALSLSSLEVARAWVAASAEKLPRTGAVTLVAMRARASEEAAGSDPETPRWLGAIRRRLLPRIPLATRLVVTAPRYVEFSLHASIEAAAGYDPEAIRIAVMSELGRRLALVGDAARRPGVPVTSRDVTARIAMIEGVRRVVALRLVQTSGAKVDEIKVPRNGLPRVNLADSVIDVRRLGSGATP